MKLRRVAANKVICKTILKNHVVELYNSHVVNIYPLDGETAMTEWLGGTIIVQDDKAFHLSTGADGILHKQQL